jgi:hypothetical protein
VFTARYGLNIYMYTPKAQWLLYVPPRLTFINSTFCPDSVFMCFVWISDQTTIISLYSINSTVCYNTWCWREVKVRTVNFKTQDALYLTAVSIAKLIQRRWYLNEISSESIGAVIYTRGKHKYFVHLKSHTDWLGIECGPRQGETVIFKATCPLYFQEFKVHEVFHLLCTI